VSVPPRVVLLHGLWMPAFSMSVLGHRLRSVGFAPESHAWTPRREGVAEAAARLASDLGNSFPTLFVGHSLGGRLAVALAARAEGQPTRVVALGTPFAGSLAARRLARAGPGRWLMRRASADVTGPWADAVPDGCELGLVAGTRPLGLGRLVTGVGRPGDGTVRIEETRQVGNSGWIELPVTHMSMLASGRVAAAVAGFLRNGKFPVNIHNL